jgi:hypothetical protein
MTKLQDLQLLQANILKSIAEIVMVRVDMMHHRPENGSTHVDAIEEQLKSAQKVIAEMQKQYEFSSKKESLLPLFADILNPYL